MIEVDHPNKCNTATPPRPTVFYLIFYFFFNYFFLKFFIQKKISY